MMASWTTEAGAFTEIDVTPTETSGEEIAHVGNVEEKQRHTHHGVDDGHHFTHHRSRRYIAVTCKVVTEKYTYYLLH